MPDDITGNIISISLDMFGLGAWGFYVFFSFVIVVSLAIIVSLGECLHKDQVKGMCLVLAVFVCWC